MSYYDVLIVGAGHAGAQAGISLRQLGFEASIAMVGDEKDPPYERPPLSKEYFAGDKSFDRILIRPASFWEERKRSEEHTSELKSLMRTSYAVFCLQKKKNTNIIEHTHTNQIR